MHANRQATYEALDALPDAVWRAYLMALRGINLMMGTFILDDPTPAEDLEAAIAEQIDATVN